MSLSHKFPLRLLAATIRERLDYFKYEVIIDHPILNETLDLLDGRANSALDRRIILLVGGTGVGKSALLRKLVARRIARQSAQMAIRPELVPAIYVEIEPPDIGGFDFNTFYREGLVEMKALLIERTVPMIERRTREGTLLTLATEFARSKLGRGGLKIRFKAELVSRDVELMGIDEAISFFKVGKVRTEKQRLENLKDQADKLKTFTNKTPATIILAGAFDFFELALTTGQLARRSIVVPMPSYHMTANGLVGFSVALTGLIAHLPVIHQLKVEDIAAELFLQSLGCIGILKEILTNALLMALNSGGEVTVELIRKSYYPAASLKIISEEMSAGMKAVQEVVSLTGLASVAESAAAQSSPSAGPPAVPLKPGETTPSHRSNATDTW